jgi:hypothetical protein
MYVKGEWQDRRRHSVSTKVERLVSKVTWELDDKGRRTGDKVTVQYTEQVQANDVYRMQLEQDVKGKPVFGHELWHRGCKVGQI